LTGTPPVVHSFRRLRTLGVCLSRTWYHEAYFCERSHTPWLEACRQSSGSDLGSPSPATGTGSIAVGITDSRCACRYFFVYTGTLNGSTECPWPKLPPGMSPRCYSHRPPCGSDDLCRHCRMGKPHEATQAKAFALSVSSNNGVLGTDR